MCNAKIYKISLSFQLQFFLERALLFATTQAIEQILSLRAFEKSFSYLIIQNFFFFNFRGIPHSDDNRRHYTFLLDLLY